jgi:hypothetical protein
MAIFRDGNELLWKEGFENPDTFAFAVASHGHPSSE